MLSHIMYAIADNAPSVLYSQIQLSKCVAINAATAHAHYELEGAMYNLGSSFKGGAHYNIIKLNPNTNGD